ncbi:response regulator [Stenomitos frigidus]|uniref:Response regulator n=1 Tax=Stenomitos frigidus ULC18 TaxID=2107698 RepID=A0A2T1DUL6_9CYAN|nr:response regulator [Stenomitos frigidus]PSB24121.1 response regulator [Stenomitos frigidus ULC18]
MTTKRILIVDDEDRIREVVRMCLVKLAKWEALSAASGTEAIQIAAVEQPDAILLDVSMPGMNGVETFQQLQANPQTQAIPVIFLTAKVQPTEQAEYKQLGAAGLIVKPFDPIQIAREISQLLGWD